VTLTQFPDPLHGSTLKSQTALLSLRAIPLSASTAKAKTLQVSAKCRSYKLVCTRSKLVNISISFCFPFPGKQKKIDTNGARVNMKHPHVNNIAEQSQHLNLMQQMKSVVQHFGAAQNCRSIAKPLPWPTQNKTNRSALGAMLCQHQRKKLLAFDSAISSNTWQAPTRWTRDRESKVVSHLPTPNSFGMCMSHGAQVGILKANTAVKRQSLKGEDFVGWQGLFTWLARQVGNWPNLDEDG